MDGRRQSSRLKTLPQKTFQDDSESDDERGQKRAVKRLRDETDEESGNDIGIEPPRKKRAKTSTSRNAKLSLLPTMSMDVLYLIFSYLPPKSLIALTEVNLVFRKALISPESTFLWTRIRKSCKAPDPFPGTLSELDWVRLLLGSNHCQGCGSKGVQSINFNLHKRICCECVYKTGVSKGRFSQLYPGEDKKILDLIMPTSGGRKHNHTYYYDKSEIDRILAGFNACKNSKQVERYTEKRREHLKRLTEHVGVCRRWENYDRYERVQEDAKNVRLERFRAIRSRLVAMGYTDKDIQIVKNHHCVTRDKILTDRGWAVIKKELLSTISYYRKG